MSQDKPVLRDIRLAWEAIERKHDSLALQKFSCSWTAFHHVIEDLLQRRQALSALERQAPGWVSVEERLPNPLSDDEFLVATGTGYVTALTFDKRGWRQDSGINDGDDYWNRHVTHWMPLPPAPGAEKEE